jgi:CelD/BcsL family acetyltransferase involved in cellulose biosynthesis
VRQNARRLEAAFGGRVSVEVIRGPDQADELVDRLDAAARATYQRGLGAGFAATDEQRALARVGLEHGWLAGYVLLLAGAPAAYWFCSRYGGKLLLRTGGFDNAYAEHRPGIYLLMRVIEEACADPEVGVLDYGPGDAAYKEQFSNESREERNAVVFAPTFRGRRINAARTVVLAPARAARSALDATQLTSRVRAHLRRSRR